jgi:hypothetical protein
MKRSRNKIRDKSNATTTKESKKTALILSVLSCPAANHKALPV